MTIAVMSPDDMAALQARAYQHMPPWSALALAEMIASAHALCISDPQGFALGRVVLDEAELLALAVNPDHQRHGIARTLMNRFETTARTRGAATCFLEVAETNAPARAFYAALGYKGIGKRGGYYPQADEPAIDALVMSKALTLG